MNFSLPPRPQNQYQHRYNNSNRGAKRNATWGLGSGYHAVDKARYVHANYRFVVDPRGDYQVHTTDADVHIDWSKVLQILASSQSQQASCPICLGHPTAPRMARCGHIFCLPCLIRYMHSEDGIGQVGEKRPKWKKCPICYDAIYTSETRPVRWYQGQEGEPPKEGMDVVLRLIRRPASTTLAMPRESPDATAKEDDIPWFFAAEVMDYARIMKGSEDYMLEQYDFDISTIKALEQEDELMFGEDAEWTGRAVRMLDEAKEKVRGMGNPPVQANKPDDTKAKKPPIVFNSDQNNVPDMYNMQSSARAGQSTPHNLFIGAETSSADSKDLSASATPQLRSPSTLTESVLSTRLADFKARQHADRQPEHYHFYQALLHYYLSPLDIRILKEAFGSYDAFPSSILPRVERVSHGHIVDDELRRRVKYLNHLPYGCEVGFLECDWTDTVPAPLLEKYKADLDRRRKRNSDKEAREEKERLRAERAGDKEFAAARRRRLNLSVDKFTETDFQPLAPATGAVGETLPVDGHLSESASSTTWIGGSHRDTHPGFATLASPGTSPSASRTVWGTTAIPLSSPELRALPRDEPVDDGWLQGWEKDLLKEEEDMIARMTVASLDNDRVSSGVSTPTTGGGKGKKKGKKITLMSTNARRGA